MAIRQIERDQWKSFFNNFSRHFENRKVSVYFMSAEFGTRAIARERPLMGVSVESDERPPAIDFLVGESFDALFSHIASSPSKVWVEQPEPGEDAALRVDCEDGTATLIDFRPGGKLQANISELELAGNGFNASKAESCKI